MSVPNVTRADSQQRISWIGGSVHRVLLDGAATQRRLAMFRSTMRGSACSPVHVHDREDETLYVLKGTGTIWAGDQRWKLKSGDTAFLPRGVPHTYLFTSDAVDLITVCNPAGMEEFFRSAGWDLATNQPDNWAVDPAVLQAAATACGQRILGPPLAAGDPMPSAYLDGGHLV
jgi:quercetin dioxygenase-like cupin family protein